MVCLRNIRIPCIKEMMMIIIIIIINLYDLNFEKNILNIKCVLEED